MGLTCGAVWRDLSDYIDNEMGFAQRLEMERHFAGCSLCIAVLDGTCNVIRLYRDHRVLALPEGFDNRLHQRLEGIGASRRRLQPGR